LKLIKTNSVRGYTFFGKMTSYNYKEFDIKYNVELKKSNFNFYKLLDHLFIRYKKLFNKKNKWISYFRGLNVNNSTKLINLALKNGYKIKYSLYYSIVVSQFYFAFNTFKTSFNNYFVLYNFMFKFSRTNLFFYNIKFIYYYLSTFLSFTFFSKLIKIAKFIRKIKKNKKKKVTLKYSFVKPNLRFILMLKQLVVYSCFFSHFNFFTRLYYSVLYTFLQWKQGTLYANKVKIYETVTKSFLKNK